MPVIATCPHCGFTGRLDESRIGQTVCCRKCGAQVTLQPTVNQSASDTNTSRPIRHSTALPSRIGRFEVRKHLGSGAFGAVFQAHDPQLERDVAVKVLRPGLLDSARHVERFLREAKAAAGLRHPNVVPVFETGREGDQSFIVSAYINGRPLAAAIDEQGMEFGRAARIVRELAEALAYAHEQGVVHRDVKPANILLDGKDRPMLADFGLAARAGTAEKLTNDGAVLGTPSYMAPEQAKGQAGDSIPASDQYSLGCVFYELLTGRTPFAGRPEVVIFNQIHTQPDPPLKLRPGVPRDLETVCLKAMAKKPADRYPDCQALADDLRRWSEDEPVTARRVRAAERVARWVRQRPTVVALAATVILLGALLPGSSGALQASPIVGVVSYAMVWAGLALLAVLFTLLQRPADR
jgi:serine/threonine protein kinase